MICACLAACAPPQDSPDTFGYEKLRRELGTATADGSGVMVQLVEARTAIAEEIDGVKTSIATGFAPNIGDMEFIGKEFLVTPQIFGHFSGHATGMGRKFFGNTISTSPGIVDIQVYESIIWLDAVLNLGRNRLPVAQAERIANHSWVGSMEHPELPGTRNVRALRRIDWLVATDEFIQVAGFNGNPNSPVFSAGWNVISTSHIDGASVSGSASVGHDDYPRDRVRPDIVVRESNPSSATARVSSAAAVLIEAGHGDENSSKDLARSLTMNRSGDVIFNAERNEVIKAALMTGADRTIFADAPLSAESSPEVTGFRLNESDRTKNGLDRRYGAGHLNVYNSYGVIIGGETNSAEDEPAPDRFLMGSGFDYDESFGGLRDSNEQGTYFLSAATGSMRLIATLVWNAKITAGTDLKFDRPARVFDLDLYLYDVSDPDSWKPVTHSASRTDNTETVRFDLLPGIDYALRVATAPGQSQFEWDYALAWRIAP